MDKQICLFLSFHLDFPLFLPRIFFKNDSWALWIYLYKYKLNTMSVCVLPCSFQIVIISINSYFQKVFHFKYWMSSSLLFKKDIYFNFIFNLWTFNNKSLNECFKFLFCRCEFYLFSSNFYLQKKFRRSAFYIYWDFGVSCFASANLDLINKQICTVYCTQTHWYTLHRHIRAHW